MKTVWIVRDYNGYWDNDVFASREAAVEYLKNTIDNDDSWNYNTEHYLRVGDIVIREVTVIG